MKALIGRAWLWATLSIVFAAVGLAVDFRYSMAAIFFEFLWAFELWFWIVVRRREKAERSTDVEPKPRSNKWVNLRSFGFSEYAINPLGEVSYNKYGVDLIWGEPQVDGLDVYYQMISDTGSWHSVSREYLLGLVFGKKAAHL